MSELESLASKIFSLLKGNGLQIKIFNSEGAETTNPSEGSRFFVLSPNIMVTINEDSNSIEFSKGAEVGDEVLDLQKNIKRLADEFLMNSTIKVFGKTIQPRDFAYQAKIKKAEAMNENLTPRNHHLIAEVLQKIKFFGSATAEYIGDNLNYPVDMSELQPVLNHLVSTGKVVVERNPHGEVEYKMAVAEAVFEDESKCPKCGSSDIKTFSDQEKNCHSCKHSWDLAPHNKSLKEGFSKMFGSLKSSQQTLENVRILVKHKTPVDESVPGARSRHISAIFLECNGERFRFPHNYLPGARAMAQHMAHGGSMNDKLGSYISESTGQLLKLQSFNRYVTTNKLINEDSSGIIETIKENIETLRTELKKLTGVKTYETVKARIETFEREALAEDDVSQLKDLFTIRRFDEKFEEVLPIVKQLVQEKDTFHKRIEEAAANVIRVRRESLNTTPMFEFASENARLGFKLSELALRIVENEELASFVGKIGNKLCKEGHVNDFEKAVLGQVFENIKVEDIKESVRKDIKESADLSAYFDKYDYKFI
jgi:ribosomal protein L9